MANFYEEAEHDVDEGSAANPVEVDDLDEEEGDVEPEPQQLVRKSKKKTPKAKNTR